MEGFMIYLILVIGLILIFIGLKKDTPRTDSSVFSKVIERKTDNKELENLREELNYLTVRIEEIENSLFSIDEKLNTNKQLQSDSSDNEHDSKVITDFYEILQENLKENKVLNTVTSNDTDNNDIKNKIYELFDTGKTVDEISSILRIGKGEVSLRLGLRKLNN
jgi:hypothetical protein